jgi:REP element-mobilizing transposase RayT
MEEFKKAVPPVSQSPSRHHPAHFPVAEWDGKPPIVFVTICSDRKRKLFDRKTSVRLFCDTWIAAEGWSVGRWVAMPDHIHFFVRPAILAHPPLKKWVQYWKALVSRQWPDAGEQPIWQQDFWDRQLRHGESYHEKWQYVVENPVRAGLVRASEEWPFQGQMNVLSW